MAWLRGLLFGLQFLVLFLGSLPSPAKCAVWNNPPPPPSTLSYPPPPEYKKAPAPSTLSYPPPPEYKKAPAPSSLPDPTPKPVKPQYNVSVEGVVSCRCSLQGYVPSKDASPLPGAVVSFKCGRRSWSGKTDAKGFFLINGKFPLYKDREMEKYLVQCSKVRVESTPLSACTVPEFLEHKGKGASISFERNMVAGSSHVALYSAGDLGLGPANSKMCHI